MSQFEQAIIKKYYFSSKELSLQALEEAFDRLLRMIHDLSCLITTLVKLVYPSDEVMLTLQRVSEPQHYFLDPYAN